jgi:hypothetical protein
VELSLVVVRGVVVRGVVVRGVVVRGVVEARCSAARWVDRKAGEEPRSVLV